MEFFSYLGNKKIKIDFNAPIDISIPVSFSDKKLRAWGIPFPKKEPVKIGDWIGSVKKGGSVNFNNLYFNPHAHVTHTECFGHISNGEESINSIQKNFLFYAKLITVFPQKKDKDLIISESMILNHISGKFEFDTLIIRTHPNKPDKIEKDYSDQNPPYLTEKCIRYIKKIGVKNLLIDLPSIDKEKDEGEVRNHKIFFDYDQAGNQNTITELIYISDAVLDGDYLLNLQVMPIENDAAPSRPVLFKIHYI